MSSGQPIIIKKVKKGGHGGHHGGAWKVAYADFVTAMMAFFLLLWLLNAVTQEQLEGISDYFSPISKSTSTSGGGGILQGETIAVKGVFDSQEKEKAVLEGRRPHAKTARVETEDNEDVDEHDGGTEGKAHATDNRADLQQRSTEDALFAAAEAAVKQAFSEQPELKQLANSLMMETTPEGLRIQIVDQDGLPMFPRGQSIMYQYTRRLLEIVSKAIRQMPQLIEISGHTDSTPFADNSTYGNWELSADRANAARRALIELGLHEARIERVVGRAATDPLFPQDPEAAGNRRLTITLLRGTSVH
jgi:Flagellar motor protein